MIINVTGTKGSGKTTALDYFAERGCRTFEIYGAYENLLEEQKLLPEDVVPKGVWDDSFVRAVYKYELSKHVPQLIFLGGLLRTSELTFLRTKDTLLTLAIVTEKAVVRYARLRERGRNEEASYTDDDFKLRDDHRSGVSDGYRENNLDVIIAQAEMTVTNDGSLVDFRKALCRASSKIQENIVNEVQK